MKTQIKEHHTPRHAVEVGKHRAKSPLSKAMRSAAYLLRGHKQNGTTAPKPDRVRPGRTEVGNDEVMFLSPQQPLAQREEVQRELGFNMGSLQATITLSNGRQVYCFDQSRIEEHGGRRDRIARYAFVSAEQVRLIGRALSSRNESLFNEVHSGVLYLTRDPFGREQSKTRAIIGSEPGAWVPGRNTPGKDHDATVQSFVPPEYRGTADEELRAGLDDTGALSIIGKNPAGVTVEFNPEVIRAQDPWPAASAVPPHFPLN